MTAQTTETRAELAPGDMGYATLPTGLTTAETIAYHKGFTRADRAFVKSTGGPGVVHDGDAPAAGTAARRMLAQTLAENGRAYRLARHDKCHRAGMAAVRSYLRKIGATDRLAELETPKPARKVTRKPAARKPRALAAVKTPAPVVAETVTPETVPAPMPKQTHAAKKASNRELAAAMRAAGIKITADSWAAAKAGMLAELVSA